MKPPRVAEMDYHKTLIRLDDALDLERLTERLK